MENLILELISQVKEVSRKKFSLDNIMNRINKTSPTIMYNKSVTFELEQMIIKGLIDQNYEILTRVSQKINTEPFPDKISFTIVVRNRSRK